jgi:hypothetical protein
MTLFPIKCLHLNLFLISLLSVTCFGCLMFNQCHFLSCRNLKPSLKATEIPATWHIEWGCTSRDVTRVLFFWLSCSNMTEGQGYLWGVINCDTLRRFNTRPAVRLSSWLCIAAKYNIKRTRPRETHCTVSCFASFVTNLTAMNTENCIFTARVCCVNLCDFWSVFYYSTGKKPIYGWMLDQSLY